MTVLINISRNSTHYLLWVVREGSQQGPTTLWRYALKACWFFEHVDEKDLPGVCRFSWILDFIDKLSKSIPFSAQRLAHLLHLLFDENLSMYQYEDFSRILFYAAAPLFVIGVFSKFEHIRDRGIEAGRARERLFTSMCERLLNWVGRLLSVYSPFQQC